MADEKKFRPPSVIPRDRDKRVPKTPPGGVPRSEDWSDAKTPVGSTDFETLLLRSGVTKEHAIQASGEIAMVRQEFKDADARLEKRLDRVDEKLDAVHDKIDRQGEKIVDVLSDTLQQHLKTASVTVAAKVQVDTAEKIDVIDERKWRRKLVFKVLALSAPFVAAAATALTLLAKRC